MTEGQTPATFSIDPYRASDRVALIEAIVDLQEVERAISDTRLPGAEVAEPYLAQLEKELSEKQGAMFVARNSEEFVGFITCLIEHDDDLTHTPASNVYGYISDAYVAPAYRGQGIFLKLHAQAEQHLLQFPHITRVRINVMAENHAARTAYEKAGYAAEEVMMEKALPRDDI